MTEARRALPEPWPASQVIFSPPVQKHDKPGKLQNGFLKVPFFGGARIESLDSSRIKDNKMSQNCSRGLVAPSCATKPAMPHKGLCIRGRGFLQSLPSYLTHTCIRLSHLSHVEI